MQEFQQALERRERRSVRILVTVSLPRLDRLQVPVAELIERQPVERPSDLCEVEYLEIRLDRRARRVELREDPPLFERPRPRLHRLACSGVQEQATCVPELVRKLSSLLNGIERE